MATSLNIPDAYDMVATLLDSDNGVGLAAPQIGVNARIFVMRDKKHPVVVFYNPEYTWFSDDDETADEGCLSEPGRYVPVQRHCSVTLRWFGQDLDMFEQTFSGFQARIIQHEMDHLVGFCKVLTGPSG